VPDALIRLQGIRAAGRHGANPGERDQPQEFVVDVEAYVEDVEEDSLDGTVDYRRVGQAVRDTVAGTSYVLLESLAMAVAAAVFDLEHVDGVTATVHKPSAAASLGVDDVAVDAKI
jgi:dihydroneopterin aldolase